MKSRSHGSRWVRLGAPFAPFAAIAALLIAPQVLRTETVVSAQVTARRTEIAAAVEAVPWRFGAWVGEDVPVPGSAISILRPNAILSRRYFHLDTKQWATLVIVHCSDVRDMAGHYPPVCYPNAGWTEDWANRETMSASVGPLADAPICIYEFLRPGEWDALTRLTVLNFFVLPDGVIATDLSDLRELASRKSLSILGVAQVQLVLSGPASVQEREDILREIMMGVDDLFHVLIPERKEDQ